jgi:D-lactate dehydrogenase (cytochrome)
LTRLDLNADENHANPSSHARHAVCGLCPDAQRRLVQRALAMDGSCTGEHGIGLTKQEYMPLEFGEDAIDVMVSIKTALDPKNLMNPGKIFPLRPRSQPA